MSPQIHAQIYKNHFVWNNTINAYSFDVSLITCREKCELFQNGLEPYCKTTDQRMKHNEPRNERHASNERLLKNPGFVRILTSELKRLKNDRKYHKADYIRFFSFGDLSCIEDLIKIVELSLKNSDVEFWLSTNHQNSHILTEYFIKRKLTKPENLTIRLSLPLVYGKELFIESFEPYGVTFSTITNDKNQSNCIKSKNGSNCGSCSDCWNGAIKIIKYFNHGLLKHRLTDYLEFFKK